ncbi:MAG: methyltransferase domain-containing protein [Chloroflexota bacterium]|jgi:SAM-dependent methyltransferase
MRIDFEREKAWWDAKAPAEEEDRFDEAINRALRWREIERNLSGIETILDIGGATGAFSIPLARRGFRVTHIDHAPSAITIARQKAKGVDNISFVEANAAELAMFADRSFDLVLNMDGAISFSGSRAQDVILESCRLAARKLIVTVSHRARLVPIWLESSVEELGNIAPAVYDMLTEGFWHQDRHSENAILTQGLTLDYLGTIQAFLPDELRSILRAAGMNVSRCGGLGTLASMCSEKALQRILRDEAMTNEFLDVCERYDRDLAPNGPGTRERAGLIAVAEQP